MAVKQWFHRVNNVLYCEDCALDDLIKTYGTPLYVYSQAMIEQRIATMHQALAGLSGPKRICFAVKANPNQTILSLMANHGLGAETVSMGEVKRALNAGIKPQDIILTGVGKTRDDISQALDLELGQINVESVEEIECLIALTTNKSRPAPIVLRVNPDMVSPTHSKISTGRRQDKFGIEAALIPEIVRRLAKEPMIDFLGLAIHIGSQIFDIQAFSASFKYLKTMATRLNVGIKHLDLGGGLGVEDGRDGDIMAYGAALAAIFKLDHPYHLTLEPGRWLIAPAGMLLTRVIRLKKADPPFVIADTAMNDLMRPALYGARHDIVSTHLRSGPPINYIVAGPVCESSDVFGLHRFNTLQAGDGLAISMAGAYGSSMASTYNSRPLAAEVLVQGTNHGLVRRRQHLKDIIDHEAVPSWLHPCT